MKMQRFRRSAYALAAAALVLSVALPVNAAEGAVLIDDFTFTPGTVTITVGEAVVWTNIDGATHTATADDDSFTTEPFAAGQSSRVPFDTAGTFPYHCEIHPAMRGTVIVQAAAGGGGGPKVTTAPTDALPVAGSPAPAEDPWGAIAFLVAVAGVSLAVVLRRSQRIRS